MRSRLSWLAPGTAVWTAGRLVKGAAAEEAPRGSAG